MAPGTFLFRQTRQAPPGPKFHLFPLLPPELRVTIWNFNVQEPRVVRITCASIRKDTLKAENSNPGALGANREAREVALKQGTLEFADIFTNAVYFNFERDTLFFPGQYMFVAFSSVGTISLPSVQNVIIARGLGRSRYGGWATERISALTRRSDSKLKTLILQNCPKSRFGVKFRETSERVTQKERIEIMVGKSVKLSFVSRAKMKELAASSP